MIRLWEIKDETGAEHDERGRFTGSGGSGAADQPKDAPVANEEPGAGGVTESDVRSAFEPTIAGISIRTHIERHGDHGWEILGLVHEAGGTIVGNFSRSIQTRSGALRAVHNELRLDREYRDQRIARRMLRACFALYLKAGVRHVELVAVDDGLLTWPRYGWTFVGDGADELHREIQTIYEIRYGRTMDNGEAAELPTFGPAVLALESEEDGYRIGAKAIDRIREVGGCAAMDLDLEDPAVQAELRRPHRGLLDPSAKPENEL